MVQTAKTPLNAPKLDQPRYICTPTDKQQPPKKKILSCFNTRDGDVFQLRCIMHFQHKFINPSIAKLLLIEGFECKSLNRFIEKCYLLSSNQFNIALEEREDPINQKKDDKIAFQF